MPLMLSCVPTVQDTRPSKLLVPDVVLVAMVCATP